METEYSKNFTFFLKEQIMLCTTNNGTYSKFFSRLNGKLFKTIDDVNVLSDDDINFHCKNIHKKLNYYD